LNADAMAVPAVILMRPERLGSVPTGASIAERTKDGKAKGLVRPSGSQRAWG